MTDSSQPPHEKIMTSLQRAELKYGQKTFLRALADFLLAAKADPDLFDRLFAQAGTSEIGDAIVEWYESEGRKLAVLEVERHFRRGEGS
jgi:hypothetical protein